MRFNLIIPVVVILISGIAPAQEVRYIDLSGVSEPTKDGVSGGSMIEAYSCVGSTKLSPQQERISLEFVETTDLHPRQRVGIEVRVENVGTVPLKLPIHPNLADLHPDGADRRFAYYRLGLELVAGLPAEGAALGVGELICTGHLRNPIPS